MAKAAKTTIPGVFTGTFPGPCGPLPSAPEWAAAMVQAGSDPFAPMTLALRSSLAATAAAMEVNARWLREVASATGPEAVKAAADSWTAGMAEVMAEQQRRFLSALGQEQPGGHVQATPL